MKYYPILIAIICIFLLFACDTERKLSSGVNPKQLTQKQVIELLENAAVQPSDSNNFHLFYKEYLNDSTWVINLIQNDFLGNDSLGICEVLDFKGHHVFIYDENCHTQLPVNMKSSQGPFQNDGVSLFLLVESRNGITGCFTLKRRFKFDDATEPIDSAIIELN